MASYNWGYKSPNMRCRYSYPTYNLVRITTHEHPSKSLNPKDWRLKACGGGGSQWRVVGGRECLGRKGRFLRSLVEFEEFRGFRGSGFSGVGGLGILALGPRF